MSAPFGNTTEDLFELFVAECGQDNSEPTISDFCVWLEDKGYNDDMGGIYEERDVL